MVGDRHAEGGGDLVGRQPCDAAQRERDLAVEVEHRMAAREDQAQAVVVDPGCPALLAVLHLVDLVAALRRASASRWRLARDDSRARRSRARRRATVYTHPGGLAGQPSIGQRSAASNHAS